MKTLLHYLCVVILIGIGMTGCEKDETSPIMESNGLSKEINGFITQDIFHILDTLGMPIHTGGNPANIEGTYLISKPVLLSSNIGDDSIGYKFEKIKISFSSQNNVGLSLVATFTQDSSNAELFGSYVVGEGNDFSVFSKIKTSNQANTDSAFSAQIYSGTWGSEGITDLFMAVVMLDNYGNPEDSYMDVGHARLIYDKDGFSEKQKKNGKMEP